MGGATHQPLPFLVQETNAQHSGGILVADRKGIMLAYPYEEKRLMKWPTPWLVQPKLDGDRCRVVFDSRGVLTLLSSTEHQITSVPHIFSSLQNMGLRDIELDGELYAHGEAHQDIYSIVSRTTNLHPDFEAIHLHLFDVISDKPQLARLVELKKNFPQSSCIDRVPVELAHTPAQVMDLLQAYMDMGYEGIIVRHPEYPYLRKRSTGMMKFKPRADDWYKVIGYEQEISINGEPKPSIGALWLESDNERFKVGSGSFLTRENRIRLWEERDSLPGQMAHIKYQSLTNRRVPRHLVLIDLASTETLFGDRT